MKQNSLWFYNKNLKPQGPLTLDEMRQLIHRGEIRMWDLVCEGPQGSWKPAMEFATFERTLFPATQEFIVGASETTEKHWVLLVPSSEGKGFSQEGPFSLQELQAGLRDQRIAPDQYVWKNGLSGWCKIMDRPEFHAEPNLRHL